MKHGGPFFSYPPCEIRWATATTAPQPQPALEVPMQFLGECSSAKMTEMINFDDEREILLLREEVE